MLAEKKKTVSLVLGSGGARGLAHIGVIHELLDSNYEIHSISSCSMGALVGGIFAAGKLDDFERWVRAISKVDIVGLLDISWGKDGLVKGDKIIRTLTDMVGDQMIESLPIKFTAVASDIGHEKEVWINSGPLFDAIRASISLPLFFTPVKYQETYLVDGGVLNPVPIAPTFNDDTDLTIAVNLGGPAVSAVRPEEQKEVSKLPQSVLHANIAQFIEKLRVTDGNGRDKTLGLYDVADQAFDSMQSTIARQKLAAYPPDYIIEIARNCCGTLEFHRADEMIDLGRRKARACIAQIR